MLVGAETAALSDLVLLRPTVPLTTSAKRLSPPHTGGMTAAPDESALPFDAVESAITPGPAAVCDLCAPPVELMLAEEATTPVAADAEDADDADAEA